MQFWPLYIYTHKYITSTVKNDNKRNKTWIVFVLIIISTLPSLDKKKTKKERKFIPIFNYFKLFIN